MNARGSPASRTMRVLSPRIEPPDRAEVAYLCHPRHDLGQHDLLIAQRGLDHHRAAFHRQARRAMRDLQGDIFVLSDASGRQLVNTERPFGEPLPPRASVSQVRPGE